MEIESQDMSRFIPLGKGIVSRAIMTASAWNILDISAEPDFSPDIRGEDVERPLSELRHMVVVPVLAAWYFTDVDINEAVAYFGSGLAIAMFVFR